MGIPCSGTSPSWHNRPFCTARAIIWFLFALMSRTDRNWAKLKVFKIMGRNNMGEMYRR